jgi:hypothetical protein
MHAIDLRVVAGCLSVGIVSVGKLNFSVKGKVQHKWQKPDLLQLREALEQIRSRNWTRQISLHAEDIIQSKSPLLISTNLSTIRLMTPR